MAVVLVPGLNCTPALYAAQISALWTFGPLTIADHTRDASIPSIVERLLDNAPPKFALVGLSMGGYIAFELMRRAPHRVTKIALLDTTARPDTPEQTAKRLSSIALAESGRFREVVDAQFPVMVHAGRAQDAALRAAFTAMAMESGPAAFVNEQRAILARRDSRPGLAAIACPTLVIVGDGDQLTPPELSQEIVTGIPGSKLVTIPNCGHLSAMERPEEVTEALRTWME